MLSLLVSFILLFLTPNNKYAAVGLILNTLLINKQAPIISNEIDKEMQNSTKGIGCSLKKDVR